MATPRALLSSENAEWYTPAVYIEAARQLMGGIDIDPASNELANTIVQATTYYDQHTNGFTKRWPGRVWLNPPYGYDGPKCNQARWSQRLIEQYQAGITTEAILLVNAKTEAKWFQPLYDYLMCFTHHRIHFYGIDGNGAQPTQGSAFIYFGRQERRFAEIFGQFGAVVRTIGTANSGSLSLWSDIA